MKESRTVHLIVAAEPIPSAPSGSTLTGGSCGVSPRRVVHLGHLVKGVEVEVPQMVPGRIPRSPVRSLRLSSQAPATVRRALPLWVSSPALRLIRLPP